MKKRAIIDKIEGNGEIPIGGMAMASKYPEIKKYILEKIKKGDLKENMAIPTERELTSLFNVSRMTVRRAVDDLINEGVLTRKFSSAPIVAKQRIGRHSGKNSIRKDEFYSRIQDYEVDVIRFSIVTDSNRAKRRLGIENEEIYKIERVQSADGIPIVYENIYLPKKYFDCITKKDCEKSMSEVVEEFQKIPFKISDIHYKYIIEAKSATQTQANLLRIEKNGPLLQTTNIAMLGNTPIYMGVNMYSGDSYSFETES